MFGASIPTNTKRSRIEPSLYPRKFRWLVEPKEIVDPSLAFACRITREATNDAPSLLGYGEFSLVALFREARNGPRGFRAGNNGRRVALTSRCLSVAVCRWQYCFVPSPAGGHEPPRFHHPDIYRSHSVFLCAVLFQRLYIVAESFTTAGHINRLIVHRGMFNSLS